MTDVANEFEPTTLDIASSKRTLSMVVLLVVIALGVLDLLVGVDNTATTASPRRPPALPLVRVFLDHN